MQPSADGQSAHEVQDVENVHSVTATQLLLLRSISYECLCSRHSVQESLSRLATAEDVGAAFH